MKLAVCVPATDIVYVPFMMSIMALVNYLNKAPIGNPDTWDFNILVERNSLLVASRQNLADKALKWGADWILFLDSDMQFPHDVVHRLILHEKPVVACNYVRRQLPSLPVAKTDGEHFIFTDPDSTGLEKAMYTGFGVALIHRGVFEKIPKPYFDTIWYKPEDTTQDPYIVGEDVFFFQAVRHFVGEDLWIDHDVSQEVVHIGTFEYHNRLGRPTYEEVHESGATTS